MNESELCAYVEELKFANAKLRAQVAALEAKVRAAQLECFAVSQWSHEAKEVAERIEEKLKGEGR